MTIEVYDNGGRTADRYTVVIGTSVFCMSHGADLPNGVNAYAGELGEDIHKHEDWGKRLTLDQVPASVGHAIEMRATRNL